MDKNHIDGIGHLVKGAVKESVGKIFGDASEQTGVTHGAPKHPEQSS